jgi:hypothetical protein
VNEALLPYLTKDVTQAAHAVGSMIKKGAGAIKKAIGQTPPTAQEVRAYLDRQGVPHNQTELLIKWGVMPHTKLSADSLGLSKSGNADHWDHKLRRFIPDPAMRSKFIKPFKEKDIGIWLPLIESDSVS